MSPINTNPYISTFGGEHIPISRLVQPYQISIHDIAHSLSLQCRFNGHMSHHYSVASHCFNCVEAARTIYKIEDAQFLLLLLLHDATEAYTGDIIRPIQTILPRSSGFTFFNYERHLDSVIKEAFCLKERTTIYLPKFIENPVADEPDTYAITEVIKIIDDRMCFTESTILGPEACPPLDIFGVPQTLYPMNTPGEPVNEDYCDFIGLTEEIHWRDAREAFCGLYEQLCDGIESQAQQRPRQSITITGRNNNGS